MNNKVLIEEINRVREVMGLPLVEAQSNTYKGRLTEAIGNPIARLIRGLNPGKGTASLAARLIVQGGPIELLFTKSDDFFWKVKNKYADELADVNDVDGLLDYISFNGDATKNIMRDMFMDSPETRNLISEAADNIMGGVGTLDNLVDIEIFIKTMDELGIPIDIDDLIKVSDDIFLKNADNPVRMAIKNSDSISKNLFGQERKFLIKKNQTNMGVEKGNVIIDVMADQGVKTSDEAYQFMLEIGMSEADAAKIKIAIEQGTTVTNDIAEQIFNRLSTSKSNEIILAFIEKVSGNKYIKNKIQIGGVGGKMTPEEIKKFFNFGDGTENLILDISEMVGTKKNLNPFKRSELPYGLDNSGWYGFYLRKKVLAAFSLKSESAYKLLSVVYGLLLFYHVFPFGIMFGKPDATAPKWLQFLFGTEGGGTFNCENNIECVLSPTGENMEKCKRQEYINLYLEHADGTASPLYLTAAQEIGGFLGTYTKEGGWFTEGSLENFTPPNYDVPETSILNKLNERSSLFGIVRVATEYYDATTRQLWDDCDLMALKEGSYGEFLSDKNKGWLGFFGVDISDTTKDILRTLMSKPQRTINDTANVAFDKDPIDAYNSLLKFPKSLWLEKGDGGIERWKCCYKGPMPVEFVQFMTSAEEITDPQSFRNMDPEDFNSFYRKYAAEKYQTHSNAYMRPYIDKEVGGVTQKVYSSKGATECGTPSILKGMTKDDMLSGMQEEMKDFLDLLSSGNNGEPPVQDGEANDGTK